MQKHVEHHSNEFEVDGSSQHEAVARHGGGGVDMLKKGSQVPGAAN